MATRHMVGAKPVEAPGAISIDRWPGTLEGQSIESQNDELWWWVLATWGVKIPRQRVCPGHDSPFDAFADAYYARNATAVWKASRGFGGKTMLLSILGMSELVSLGAYATILGGSGAQSLRVHETMQEAWNYQSSPSYLLLRDPTKFDTYLTNGGHARTLMASTKSVRGPHPQRMRLDEIDEMEMKVLESAQGQPMRKKNLDGEWVETSTVMSSTHQYPNGTMTAILKRAKEQKWKVYNWCLSGDSQVTMANGKKQLRDIVIGDKVLGWKHGHLEYAVVSWSGYTKTSATVDIRLGNGNVLTCTPDHKILTNQGWKEAATVEVGEWLVGELPAVRGDSENIYEQFQPSKKRYVPAMFDKEQNSNSRQVLSGLRERNSQVWKISSMLDVRSQADGASQQGGLSNTSDGSCSERYSQQREEFQGRGSSNRTSGISWGELSEARSDGSVHGGLLSTGTQNSDRGVRGLLAQSTECEGTSSASSCCDEGSRLATLDSVGVRTPLVDATNFQEVRVESVSDGEVIDTYDITVPGLDSFVAEGVVVHNCFRETSNPIDGWLDPTEIERKRTEITAAMWAAEYDLQEPSFEGRAIDEASVDVMFDPDLGVAQASEGKYIEITPPNITSDYITGVDWAKSKDYTIIWTFDTTTEPWMTVAFERIQRRPWPSMIDRLNKRLARYGGKVAHDATGLGGVIDDYIEIPKDVRPRDIHAVIMGGRNRSDMITNYVSGIEQKLIKAPRLLSVYDDHRFATPDDLYNGSASSHLPDSIAAGALAWSLRNTWTRVAVPVDLSFNRPTSPWKI